jgi:Carboxypeptidase regulatory-like domain
MRYRFAALSGLFCLLSTVSLQAQSSTGEIDVTVTDASDALVAGARIIVKGWDTGAVARTNETNASGIATVPLLNPGIYDVTVEKDGFKTAPQASRPSSD